MSKVYLHDEATGTKVEKGEWSGVFVETSALKQQCYTPAEFRAVIEGGLRWMLETAYAERQLTGRACDDVQDFVDTVFASWEKGR